MLLPGHNEAEATVMCTWKARRSRPLKCRPCATLTVGNVTERENMILDDL